MVAQYKQCVLRCTDGDERTFTTVFIPVELARFGTILHVKGEGRSWKVIEVGPPADEEMLNSYRKEWQRFERVIH